MSREAAEILKKALRPPKEARADLITSLLDSLDPEIDVDADRLWQEEIARRVQQLDSGAVQTVSWTDLRSRVNSKLRDAG